MSDPRSEPAFDLSVVIPAFNEAQRLPSTLDRLAAYFGGHARTVEVIVVDDGSSDGTALVRPPAASAPNLTWRLLRNPGNRGKGYSVRHGMLAARGERLLFSDADLSAPIEEIVRLDAALDAGADIAIGSRSQTELLRVRQNPLRENAGRVFNLIVRLTLGLPYRDTQCGFKLFRRAAARAIFARQCIEGWGFDPELLFLARRQGWTVREVPVVWSHAEGAKIRMVRDSMRMFVEVARIRINAWRGESAPTSAAEPEAEIASGNRR